MNRFAKFSWGVLAWTLLNILWGALVRATKSGTGCGSHWPDCNGEIIPTPQRIETILEFAHRALSGVALLLVLALLIWVVVRAAGLAVRPGVHPVRSGPALAVWTTVRVLDEARTWLFPLYSSQLTSRWLRALGARIGRDVEASTVLMIPALTYVNDLAFLADDTLIGGCGFGAREGDAPELGYWLGAPYWGKGYATEAVRAVADYAFTEGGYEFINAGARVTNPASRRVLEKCGFQWTGVGLYRIRAISSSAPIDRFRLERRIWESLKSWREVRRVA